MSRFPDTPDEVANNMDGIREVASVTSSDGIDVFIGDEFIGYYEYYQPARGDEGFYDQSEQWTTYNAEYKHLGDFNNHADAIRAILVSTGRVSHPRPGLGLN